MNSGKRNDISKWPTILTVVILSLSLGTLTWLQKQMESAQEASIQNTADRFAATGVIGRPESTSIVFSELETFVRVSKGGAIRELHVTKTRSDGSESTVYPYYLDLIQPDWNRDAKWRKIPVGSPAVGFLYIDENRTSLRAVRLSILVLSLMLIAGFFVLLFRQRGKEVEVNQLQSELQERKNQIIQLERLALAGQLSANVFHDIKKPVLNIKHEVTDFQEGEDKPDEILRTIRLQTDLFLDMLRDLGMESFVNTKETSPEWCDLHDCLERSQKLVRYEQGNVELESPFQSSETPLVKGYPYRYIQLFSNLILNAYQALDGSGVVRLSLSVSDDSVTVLIEDSGPGIPSTMRKEIFDPFITSRSEKGGSGLGLYICKMIVEESGGVLEVEDSEELGGAKFVVTLSV